MQDGKCCASKVLLAPESAFTCLINKLEWTASTVCHCMICLGKFCCHFHTISLQLLKINSFVLSYTFVTTCMWVVMQPSQFINYLNILSIGKMKVFLFFRLYLLIEPRRVRSTHLSDSLPRLQVQSVITVSPVCFYTKSCVGFTCKFIKTHNSNVGNWTELSSNNETAKFQNLRVQPKRYLPWG